MWTEGLVTIVGDRAGDCGKYEKCSDVEMLILLILEFHAQKMMRK